MKKNAIIFMQKSRVWIEMPNITFAEGTQALVSPNEGENSSQTAERVSTGFLVQPKGLTPLVTPQSTRFLRRDSTGLSCLHSYCQHRRQKGLLRGKHR